VPAGESNLLPTLITRNLFTLRYAQNAESAKSLRRGYAAVTPSDPPPGSEHPSQSGDAGALHEPSRKYNRGRIYGRISGDATALSRSHSCSCQTGRERLGIGATLPSGSVLKKCCGSCQSVCFSVRMKSDDGSHRNCRKQQRKILLHFGCASEKSNTWVMFPGLRRRFCRFYRFLATSL
jgi:hypothetical protein